MDSKCNRDASIYDVKTGGRYIIEQLPDEAVLNSMGFRVGQNLVKKRAYRFGGPVVVEADTSLIALGKDMAQKIIVKECV